MDIPGYKFTDLSSTFKSELITKWYMESLDQIIEQ